MKHTGSSKQSFDKVQCPKCLKSYELDRGFYTADESLYPSGRFHLCKSCIEEIIDVHGHKGFIMILRAMNRPFDSVNYSGDYKSYLRQVATLRQYKGKTFDDSVFDSNNNDIYVPSDSSEEIQELVEYWGKGYTEEDLRFLQSEYQKLINSYECDNYAMELLFQEAAQQRLAIKKLRLESKSVDKELKTLQDLLGSANIKPVQETGANATEQATFGTLIKKYENERPIPQPDKEWQDVDGIKKYVSTWFFGHLTKMMGIKNEHSEDYEKEIENYTVKAKEYEEETDL